MATNPTPQQPPQEEIVNLAMSRETFEMAKQFISTMKQAVDAADAKIKADLKGIDAESKMAQLSQSMQAQPPGMEGLGDELTAASNQRLGF